MVKLTIRVFRARGLKKVVAFGSQHPYVVSRTPLARVTPVAVLTARVGCGLLLSLAGRWTFR